MAGGEDRLEIVVNEGEEELETIQQYKLVQGR